MRAHQRTEPTVHPHVRGEYPHLLGGSGSGPVRKHPGRGEPVHPHVRGNTVGQMRFAPLWEYVRQSGIARFTPTCVGNTVYCREAARSGSPRKQCVGKRHAGSAPTHVRGEYIQAWPNAGTNKSVHPHVRGEYALVSSVLGVGILRIPLNGSPHVRGEYRVAGPEDAGSLVGNRLSPNRRLRFTPRAWGMTWR